ncbi:hypothetical protein [Streptomyces sp. NPDC059072]|uniref:hypothetical protein n=1 Tax=Streptomyces sp. NPDC059072 TaxID=3346715 RepID=UPI003684FF1D
MSGSGSGTEQVLKESIGEVADGYRATGDPFVRVEKAVRLRRRRNRRLVGASVATVVAASVGVMAALPGDPGQRSVGPAATSPAGPAGEVLPGYEMVPGTVYRVARGTYTGIEWQVGSAEGRAGQACMVSRNALLGGIGACFPTGDGRIHWAAASPNTVGSPEQPFTIVGVAPAGAARVKVVLSDGSRAQAETVATPTATDTRFFSVLVPSSIRQQVHVQAFNAAGSPVGGPVSADDKQDFKDRTPPWCRTGGDHPEGGPDPTTGPPTMSDLVAGAPCGTPSSALGRPVSPTSAPPPSGLPR